ncbi:MAG TPA: OmcA/MtrC family decaheme c-type cytochrome [Kofleriaceae bacterium]|nr:OmcA/MtrC family decaheme c-type cytochrome [Kofleriaceae bacterium]
MRIWIWTLAVCAACEGPRGPAGASGPDGAPAAPGAPGEPGTGGEPGDMGTSPWLTDGALHIEVRGASVERETATVTFRLTDGNGVPVDREGLLTEGVVELSFALAWLDQANGEPAQYTAYTTRVQESPLTGDSATQAATESSGTFEAADRADGVFRYTFAAPIAVRDSSRTHSVLISGSRTVDGTVHRASAVYDFVPGGGAVSVTREVVSDASCTTCHGQLEAHGGRYTTTSACVMCHTPQSTDPDTGNTLDFRVMVHRIHRGASLPSVVAGTPYRIIGFNQSVADFSTVHFPQEIARCEACHDGAQGDYWKRRPSRQTCVSCHDDISFVNPPPAGLVLHGGGAQPDDAPCAVCHPATGSLAGIADVHLLPVFDPAATRVELELLDVLDAAPGEAPAVQFRVQVDGAPRDILTAPLTRLTATFAGPNSDYATYWQSVIQGSGAVGTLTAIDAAQGTFQYLPPSGQPPAGGALPADASGSYTVGLEGYVQATGAPRFAAVSPVFPFAVTDDEPHARRQVVDGARCNNCHHDLAAHGGGRKGAQYCTLCHNANNPNDERVARFEAADVFVETVDFRVMIHKIHAGEDLTQPYVLGGNPTPNAGNPAGTPIDFAETRYPRRLADCSACHADGTFELPLAIGLLPSILQVRTCLEDPAADTNAFCDGANWVAAEEMAIGPTAAVCTSCHDAPFTQAHAEVMTTDAGEESCATCHGPGSILDVAVVHAR